MNPACQSILKTALGKHDKPEKIAEYERMIKSEYRRIAAEDPNFDAYTPELKREIAAKRVKQATLEKAALRFRNKIDGVAKLETIRGQLRVIREAGGSAMDAVLSSITRVDSRKETFGANLANALDVANDIVTLRMAPIFSEFRLQFGEFSVDPKLQKEFYKSLNGEPADPKAKEIADWYRKNVEAPMIKEYIAAGGVLDQLDNHIPRDWQADAIREKPKEFVDKLIRSLDRNKMRNYDGSRMNDEQVLQFAEAVRDGIIGKKEGTGRRRDMGLNMERQLHFVNAEAEFEMAQQFGNPDVLNAMYQHMLSMRRETVLIDRYGTNYRENMKALVDEAFSLDSDVLKSGDAANRLNDLKQTMDYILDGNVVNAKFARLMQGVRAWISATSLGGMGLNITPDFAGVIANAVASGMSVTKAAGIVGKSLTEIPKDPTLRRITQHQLFAARYVAGAISRHFMDEVSPSGKFVKTAKVMASAALTWSGARRVMAAQRQGMGEALTRTYMEQIDNAADYETFLAGSGGYFDPTTLSRDVFYVMKAVSNKYKGDVGAELAYRAIEEMPEQEFMDIAMDAIEERVKGLEGAKNESLFRHVEIQARGVEKLESLGQKIREERRKLGERAAKIRERKTAADEYEARYLDELDIELERRELNYEFSKTLLSQTTGRYEVAKLLQRLDDLPADKDSVQVFLDGALGNPQNAIQTGIATLAREYQRKLGQLNARRREVIDIANARRAEADEAVKAATEKTDAKIEKIRADINARMDKLENASLAFDSFFTEFDKQIMRTAEREATNLRRRAQENFNGIISEFVSFGMGELSARTMSRFKKGDWAGEMALSAMQFTASPVMTFVNNTFRMMGKDAPLTTKAAIAANYMAQTLIYGALVYQANALLSGQDPYDVLDEDGNVDWRFISGAASRGIGVTQFLALAGTSDYDRQQVLMGTLGGPLAGYFLMYLDVLGDLTGLVTEEDKDKALSRLADSTIRAVKRSTPFQNLFYTKQVTDRAIFFNLQNMLAPEILEKRMARMERRFGATYYWDPREALPSRPPDILQTE